MSQEEGNSSPRADSPPAPQTSALAAPSAQLKATEAPEDKQEKPGPEIVYNEVTEANNNNEEGEKQEEEEKQEEIKPTVPEKQETQEKKEGRKERRKEVREEKEEII